MRVWRWVFIVSVALVAVTVSGNLSRKRRYLVFPEGSSIVLRVSNVKRMPFNVTLPWQLATEAEEKYPLPDHYIRKKGKRPPAGKDKKKQSPKQSSAANNTSGWLMGTKSKGNKGENKNKWQHDQWRVTPLVANQWGRPFVDQYGVHKEVPGYVFSDYGTFYHPEQYFKHGHYENQEPFFLHRRDRRDIYERVETLLDARGMDGRACILRALCDASMSQDVKGSFIHDVLRLIFTLPVGSTPDMNRYEEFIEDCETWTERCPYSLLLPDLLQDN